ncbi:MAG: UDP-3-O-acyl-N-acetylglucosamine deacetylase [Candidatus Cryptobacteroides sp.]|nr:UDP-3-O-acyl-N-acetylglucosamine deacetylase [Candidatus Cryptobacteroides sp.]
MTSIKQQTLAGELEFKGKGLHTGRTSRMVLKPAPAGTGILFRRVDLGPDAIVEALAENISSTARSTTISKGEASVATIEHIMSALTGMGVDNAIIDIDNVEVPILDGSARFYVEAIAASGTVEQDALREYVDIPEEIEVRDEKTGSFVRVTPSDKPGIDVTIDFGSKVLGVQTARWDESTDYASEIAPCRTFVFLHEIAYLFQNNLVKGGDMDNAIVIAEHPVTEGQLSELSALFNVPKLEVKEGYLNNLQLRFPDECGRHKLLDLVGDLRLAGGYLNAKVTAFKPGHTINSQLTKAIRERIR